ncbi:camphor resistance protein CrcB [Sphingopyxis sp. H038]|uniref:fluoride efflux transporter CrcB n=1 Tax=unclassified Sphingopyxis TaxID=2614943 RepID=UPI0007306492|nr:MULTISPECIES: fluoride efflux transporter CrcB [unclassified Sphingopyxis]KTE00470.1 camphor resistance protein CrcB [Sphingopyxis sp. H012]KTE08363.1 camphor resistance protein CrcB [Sphingopyxis sp. H053]KTE12989.1 camphor resistance protein CrcB [Sphingopyxis sp. H093]KTE26918.1 camphor resistance protein CrcB [Sphingopyxis sp. H080]KTE33096.1 camphor resistance protein CrcB [Sphingopyxis sp. H038]
MNSLFPVMIGGAIGAGARHLVGQAMLARFGPAFPWGTLSINIVGSLLMGLLVGWLVRSGGGDTTRLFVGVGILGGFTTFSSFSMEYWMLFERGQNAQAAAYVLASVVGAIAACGLGLFIVRQVPA